jgi:hypothetical protein
MGSSRWIGPLVAAVALPLVYGTLRLLLPARPPEPGERSLEELGAEFDRWARAGVLLWLLLFTPLAGYLCWEAFRELGARIAAELPHGVYRSLPGGVTWALPAALFGMLAGALGVDALLRLLLRRRYGDFSRYQERVAGFGAAATLPLLAVLSLAGGLLVFAIGDWYVVVTPDEIVHDGLLAVHEQRHAHADVVGIRTAPYLQGLLGGRPRRVSVIRYADGSSWTIDDMPAPISNGEILALTHYVSERSGVPVEDVESIRPELF